jgi:hypothetical protein
MDSKDSTTEYKTRIEETHDIFLHADTVIDVVPKLEKPWFRYPYLLKLNIFLLGALLVNITSGYDGSMMNGEYSLRFRAVFVYFASLLVVEASGVPTCVIPYPFGDRRITPGFRGAMSVSC